MSWRDPGQNGGFWGPFLVHWNVSLLENVEKWTFRCHVRPNPAKIRRDVFVCSVRSSRTPLDLPNFNLNYETSTFCGKLDFSRFTNRSLVWRRQVCQTIPSTTQRYITTGCRDVPTPERCWLWLQATMRGDMGGGSTGENWNWGKLGNARHCLIANWGKLENRTNWFKNSFFHNIAIYGVLARQEWAETHFASL